MKFFFFNKIQISLALNSSFLADLQDIEFISLLVFILVAKSHCWVHQSQISHLVLMMALMMMLVMTMMKTTMKMKLTSLDCVEIGGFISLWKFWITWEQCFYHCKRLQDKDCKIANLKKFWFFQAFGPGLGQEHGQLSVEKCQNFPVVKIKSGNDSAIKGNYIKKIANQMFCSLTTIFV